MARNRKRAKERRSRRPNADPITRPGVATARSERERHEIEYDTPDAAPAEPGALEEAPSPLEHATPDVELAAAQLALGRPELAIPPGESESESEFEAESSAGEAGRDLIGEDLERAGTGEVAAAGASPPAAGRFSGHRLINFLQGSWRELQRVQWPDRRQVMQATGVVIGFVIVAGVFLGVADTVAAKIVDLILK